MIEAVLLNRNQVMVGRLHLREEVDGRYLGTVDLEPMPAELRQLFEEFESLVSDQIFNLADEVQDRIDTFGLQVGFTDGPTVPVRDVQISPSNGRVVLRLSAPIPQPTPER